MSFVSTTFCGIESAHLLGHLFGHLFCHLFGESEVHHLEVALRVDEQVLGLEVAVDGALSVQMVQSQNHLTKGHLTQLRA